MWLVIAAAWIIWWIRRPLLIPRYLALQKEREDLLTTNTDLMVGIGVLVLAVALAFGSYAWARDKFPRTVPLQAGRMYAPPLPYQAPPVKVEFQQARYDVPGRSMRMSMSITNVGTKPLRLGEFATASIRFVNQDLPAAQANVTPGYPTELVARNGLVINDDTEIKPGETKTHPHRSDRRGVGDRAPDQLPHRRGQQGRGPAVLLRSRTATAISPKWAGRSCRCSRLDPLRLGRRGADRRGPQERANCGPIRAG